jgi:formylglycine-generating enzyme required for sulfatase activity
MILSSPRFAHVTAFSLIVSTLAHGSDFQPTVESGVKAPGEAPPGMVWIPGGEFSMGALEASAGHCSPDTVVDARPVLRVKLDGFWMDRTEVTNAEFAKFVAATGYKTIAEIPPTKEEFPDAPPEALVAGAVVFRPAGQAVSLDNHLQWWTYVKGASWRHPEGPESSIQGRENHPVVHVTWPDAVAYAEWAGKRLPTEAEWEMAARGGLSGKPYAWGEEFQPGGKAMANTWQGRFPIKDEAKDGFAGTAPVGSYPANGYGLHDMSGNVWEWVADWYRADAYPVMARAAAGKTILNPKGPSTFWDPSEPGMPKRGQRGGSFLCTDQYCTRYIVGTRGKGEIKTATHHTGFRCVKSPPTEPARPKDG